jgi:threonine aldolase
MRQSGIIAAGALYALEHNIPRLQQDHVHARLLADAVRASGVLQLDPEVVDTNIVIFRVDTAGWTAADFCQAAKQRGVWLLPFSRRHVRAVTHLHIREEDALRAGKIVAELAASGPQTN